MFRDSSLGLSWVTDQPLVLILEAGQFAEDQWEESCFSENQCVWLAFSLPTQIHPVLSRRSLLRAGRSGRETMRKRRWYEVDEPNSGDLAQVQIIIDCENLGKSLYLLEPHSLICDMGTIIDPTSWVLVRVKWGGAFQVLSILPGVSETLRRGWL